MNSLTPTQVRLLSVFDKGQIALIKKTVAKDCNDSEFDLFMTVAASLKLNPLKKQIYAFVFNKDSAKKRQMALVTGIGGFRTIADRTGDYKPDGELPTFEYDESLKGPSNPLGIKSCTARVFKYRHGEWHSIPNQVFWEAYAPLEESGTWEDRGETWPDGNAKKTFVGNGAFKLDDGKPRWRIDGRGMLAKCAEAGALRKGWPDEMAGIYEESEVDRGSVVELSPAEYAEEQAVTDRLAKVGAKDTILFQFPPEDLKPIAHGRIFDAAMAYFRDQDNAPDAIEYWRDNNRHGLQEFWAHKPGDALALKAEMEKLITVGREKEAAAKAAEGEKEKP